MSFQVAIVLKILDPANFFCLHHENYIILFPPFIYLEPITKSYLFNKGINFLISLGIRQRAEQVTKKLPFSKKADVFYRIDRLINENKMGNLFNRTAMGIHDIYYLCDDYVWWFC